MPFPSENINQILNLVTWGLIVFGAIWLVTSVLGAMNRRAYNLTHAESGGSKKIQPDFLQVDKAKREAAIARGERYEEQLAKREAPERPASPVSAATTWSRIAASATALIGVAFTAVTTMQRIPGTDEAVRDLGNWEKLKTLVSQHQMGAVLCIAIIASNAYIVVKKLQKSGGE